MRVTSCSSDGVVDCSITDFIITGRSVYITRQCPYMAIGSLIFDQLKISNSCYMAAAIQFNYAMFHIFSGPLFANLATYAFLDLIIWGVSPILFQLCRNPLKQQIKPFVSKTSQNYGRSLVRRRFMWLLACCLAILTSYLFMNYSPSFRWNYFSRIANLDFGYLLFDLACRCMELIVEIEEQEQQQMLIEQNRETMEPVYHKGGYCKYRNLFMMASYFMVFYLSTMYDTNDSGSGQQIFTSVSVLSCIFTLAIPFLYLFRHRSENYNIIDQSQQPPLTESLASIGQLPDTDRRSYFIFVLTSFSYFVNTSYFSLWVMEGLAGDNQSTYKQFNKTLFISSIFFLASSFILFVVAHLYIGCTVRDGEIGEVEWLVKMIKPFLIGYGLLMMAVFVHWKSQWQYMVIPILPFGFLQLIVNVYSDQISAWKQQDKRRYGTHKLNFLIQTTAYMVLPIVFAIFRVDNYAIHIFGWLSALSLICAGALIPSKKD